MNQTTRITKAKPVNKLSLRREKHGEDAEF